MSAPRALCWMLCTVVATACFDAKFSLFPTGHAVHQTTPVAVAGGLSFVSLTAGGEHTCGVAPSRAAYCWGSEESGELGNGTSDLGSTLVAVAGGLTFASLTAGGEHTCGLTSGKTAYCWGANWHGQLGDRSTGWQGNTSRCRPSA